MRFRTPSSVAVILALVFFVVVSVEPPSALQAQEPLQIAWAGPLTGDVAQLGQGWLNGVKLALDEWNAKGGVLGRKVVVAPEDDACDPKQAATVATNDLLRCPPLPTCESPDGPRGLGREASEPER